MRRFKGFDEIPNVVQDDIKKKFTPDYFLLRARVGIVSFFSDIAEDSQKEETKESLLALFDKEGPQIANWFSEEVSQIFSLLNLSEIVKQEKVVIEFSKESTFSIKTDSEGSLKIIFPRGHLLRLLLHPENVALKVRYASSLAHEAFHAYTALYYQKADKKTVIANRELDAGNDQLYQKDHGELASSLFEVHYLKEKLKVDPQNAEVYQNEIAFLEKAIRTRTADSTIES